MNILVTGSKGFLGSYLCQHLRKFQLNVVELHRGVLDLTNSSQVNEFFSRTDNFDCVIHCAAKGGSRLKEDESTVLNDNLRMYYNLLDNRKSYHKFISFGSGAELYKTNTAYGFSKKIIYESIKKNDYFYNLRIYGLFNYGELNTRFIKSNLLKLIYNEDMVVHKNKYMDFFHMDDILKLINFYIFSENLPKVVDCCYKDKINLFDICKEISKLDQSYSKKIKILEAGEDAEYTSRYRDLPIKCQSLSDRIKQTHKELIADIGYWS